MATIGLPATRSACSGLLLFFAASMAGIALKKGRNELVLAVSELGGGWGFVCRWAGPPE